MSNKTQLQANNIELQEILEIAGNLQETKREFNPGEVTLDSKYGENDYLRVPVAIDRLTWVKDEDYPTIAQYFINYEEPLSVEEMLNGDAFYLKDDYINLANFSSSVPNFTVSAGFPFLIDDKNIIHAAFYSYDLSSTPRNSTVSYATTKDGVLWEVKASTPITDYLDERVDSLYLQKINDTVIICVYVYESYDNKSTLVYKYNDGSLTEIYPKGGTTRFAGEAKIFNFNNYFVICDEGDNEIYYSSNGTTWTKSSYTPYFSLMVDYFFVWNGKMFYNYGVSGNQYYYCTTPGGSWTAVKNTPWSTTEEVDMSLCGDYLVAMKNSSNASEGQPGAMYYSTNGISWTANNNFSYTRQLYQYCSYIDGYYIIKIYNFDEGKKYLYYSKTINGSFTSANLNLTDDTSVALADDSFVKNGYYIITDLGLEKLIKNDCPYLILPRYTEDVYIKL